MQLSGYFERVEDDRVCWKIGGGKHPAFSNGEIDLHGKKNARDLIWSRAEMGLFVFQGFYFFGG